MLSKLRSNKLWAVLSKRYSPKKDLENFKPKAMSNKTIQELGYIFNDNGQLRKIGEDGQPTEEPFQFNISDVHRECQDHYEELGHAVTKHIYHLLETEVNLTRLPVPKDAEPNLGTFIFVSEDYDKKDVLMVLIHGLGAVRAGQWARSLIINECIDMGTQIPYIKKALEKDYGVMVLNTNDNYQEDGTKKPSTGTNEEHACYVWDTYISNTNASSIVIVAHSYGGVVTVALANEMKEDFEKRVKAIAFTDSVHYFSEIPLTDFMKKVAKNWVATTSPLDTPIKTADYDITRVSAGHPKHEMTSYTSFESVFKFVEEMLTKT
ncbi:cotranscriptional regulator ARB2A [Epargyreus clarus]|uniref:cotranscriptional regulator ARB2A n=1 Tax=Epargyreus clarus TaxID=520877 RepID=UPI003C2CA629